LAPATDLPRTAVTLVLWRAKIGR